MNQGVTALDAPRALPNAALMRPHCYTHTRHTFLTDSRKGSGNPRAMAPDAAVQDPPPPPPPPEGFVGVYTPSIEAELSLPVPSGPLATSSADATPLTKEGRDHV